MKTVKSILLPVDFSAIATGSYQYALKLAEELSASVHLLRCLPPGPTAAGAGGMIVDVTPQLFEQEEANLREFMEAGLSGFSAVRVRKPEVVGSVSYYGLREGIKRYVEEFDIDLVVIGTHGVHDNWDRLFGTNAAGLLGIVKAPVLVLPADAAFRPLTKICFATDLRESDLLEAERLSSTLALFRPEVNYLHVHLSDDKQTSGALDLFRRAFEQPRGGVGPTFTTVFNEDVTDGIFGYLEKNPHDLLVMIKPTRSWWDRMFVHSDTKESAGITNIPLLVIGEQG